MKSKSKPVSKKNNKASAPKTNFWQLIDRFLHNKWVIGVMLVIVSFVYNHNYYALYDRKVDLNGDNIYYYSLGQALHQGEGYTNIISWEKTPHGHYPPGYSWFISKVMKISPDNIQTIKKTNGFLMYLSVILLFFVVFCTTGNSVLAFCSSMLMSVHKELLRFATIMMSETLFIFLSLLAVFLAILLVKGIIGTKRPWVGWVTIAFYGLIIAYTYLVRTMGLSLILALVGWLGILAVRDLIRWRKASKNQDEEAILPSKRQFFVAAILCLVTIVAVGTAKLSWDARNRSHNIVADDYKANFMKKTNNEDMEGIADWKTRIKSNTSHFITRWIPEVSYMKKTVADETPITAKEWILGLLLIAIMVAGCLYMNPGCLLFLFYVALTVAVLILYPEQYGGTRYLVPIIPVFIFLLLNGISAVVAGIYKVSKLSHSPLLAQSIVLLILTFGVLMPKYTEAQEEYKKTARIRSWHNTLDVNVQRFLEAAQYCGDSIPKDAHVICRKPEIFYMFSDYHQAAGFPLYADPDTIYKKLCRDSVDYVIVDGWFRHAYVTLWPCIQKYPEKFKEVKKFGDVDTARKINPTFIFRFNDEWGYRGDMKDGKREGKGILRMSDGRAYEGEFSNNLPNGQGTLYDSSGRVLVSGRWKDGVLVR